MSRHPEHLIVRAALAMAATVAVAGAIAVAPNSISADANEGAPGPPRRAASVITSGDDFSCVRLANGTVKCWGNGSEGRLGQGSTADIGNAPGEMGDNLNPVDLGTGRTATAIAAGRAHACALLDNGTVKCWGDNNRGQLGQGNTTTIGDDPGEMGDNLNPVNLGPGRTATAIAGGFEHTCALLDDATVKCWGDNTSGQLGQGNTTNIGDGIGPSVAATSPIDLGPGRTATAIAAGVERHTCALLDDATVKCWGDNTSGQLGQGNTTNIGDGIGPSVAATSPIDLGPGRSARAVSAGSRHTCALLDDGTVKCWGRGNIGQLGQGNTDDIGDGIGPSVAATSPIDLGSGPGNLVMPLMVPPTPPLGVAAVAGVESAALSWSAPSDDGSAPITGYRIQSSTDGSTWTTRIADTGSSATTRTLTGLTANVPVRFRVAAINTTGVGAWSAPTAPITPGAGYIALDPARLLDTRPGGETTDMQFTPGVKLVGGEEIALQVTGRGNVPADADAVVLNVTVNEPDLPGFITAYPCGTTRPNASNLNYVTGQTIPNTVISKIGTNGQVCLYSDQTTHLLADVNGSF